MTEKLKVSREVAEIIDAFKKCGYTFQTFMETRIEIENRFSNDLGAENYLKALTLEELATALINGYEVEMTPHEVIAKKYRDAKRAREDALGAGENDTALFNGGVMAGINCTLRALDTTVEGVNDHDSKD